MHVPISGDNPTSDSSQQYNCSLIKTITPKIRSFFGVLLYLNSTRRLHRADDVELEVGGSSPSAFDPSRYDHMCPAHGFAAPGTLSTINDTNTSLGRDFALWGPARGTFSITVKRKADAGNSKG